MNILFAKSYQVGLLQGKTYRVLQYSLNQALEFSSLNIPEWKILGQLYDHKQLKLGDIASILSVEPPLITLLISSLEKKKLIIKQVDKNDKRIINISLTEIGKKIIPKIEKNVRASMRQILKGVTLKEIATYIKVLEIMVNNGKTQIIKKSFLIE